MSRIIKKISQFIPEQLPGVVRENFQTFIEFLQAYYEWMEEESGVVTRTEDLLSYRDIDTTLDEFISHFQHEFLLNIPDAVLADKRKLAKHIKQFYRARGTEKSYKFLFRILYNENVEFYYPKVDLLRPSDGRWVNEKVLRVSTIHDTFTYASHKIVGELSGATAYVENVIQFAVGPDTITELYLSNVHGEFGINEKINVYLPDRTVQEYTYGVVSGVQIINAGSGYKEGDTIDIYGGTGSGAVIVVDSVQGEDKGRAQSASNEVVVDTVTYPAYIILQDMAAKAVGTIDAVSGTLKSIRLINSGAEYETAPTVLISGGGATINASATAVLSKYGTVDYITVDTPGVGYVSEPEITILAPRPFNFYRGLDITINDGPGVGETKTILLYDPATNKAVIEGTWSTVPDRTSHYTIELGRIKTLKVKDFGVNYSGNEVLDFSRSGNGDAQGTVVVAAIGRYPGTWITTDSFLDSDKRLQDSKYWQDFSYVLKAKQSINTYRNVVKKLLHPAGLALFGQVNLVGEYLLGPTYRTLERMKFNFSPYLHYRKLYQVNAGDPDAYTNPLYAYPAPNADYYTDEWGPTNTRIEQYAPTLISDVVLTPNTKRNHVADMYIAIRNHVNSLIDHDMYVEYDCLEGPNPQTLYDVQIVSPAKNGYLGSSPGIDVLDPFYTPQGLAFDGLAQYASAPLVLPNPLRQTVIVVAKTVSLATKQTIIGSIDSDKPDQTTGYAINIIPDGSLEFVAQKYGDTLHTLSASFPAGTIVPNQFFMAALRYKNNTLTGNFNNLSEISTTFGTNVDGSSISNTSKGYRLGSVGFIPPTVGNAYWGRSFYGAQLLASQFSKTEQYLEPDFFGAESPQHLGFGGRWRTRSVSLSTSVTIKGFFLNGTIAYVIIYNEELTDAELLQNYVYLRNTLLPRGISLP